MSRVQVFDLAQRAKSKNPWYVRWRVDGRDASKQFRTKAAARDFHARLLVAADHGERFDPATKQPRSWATPATPMREVTCYLAAVGFMHHKWDRWAAATRRSAVETLVIALKALHRTDARPSATTLANVHRWLREVALIRPSDPGTLEDRCRDQADREAHAWLVKHSLPIGALDRKHAERVLDAFAVRLDGTGRTSATVITRRRTQFGGFVKYCIREGHLAADPLQFSDWKRPLIDHAVSKEVLLAPGDMDRLLIALTYAGRLGPRLVAFFATLFYAGLRTGEALALTPGDLTLPEQGWGEIAVRRARTKVSARYTNDGAPTEERHLKWRSSKAIRYVAIPPTLVSLLRQHRNQFCISDHAPLFTNLCGNPLDHARYQRVFRQAKDYAFPPDSPLRQTRPYDLRHSNASLLLNAGVPIPEAARRLGHGPDVLLAVYAGTTTTDAAVSNARIDQHLAATRPATS